MENKSDEDQRVENAGKEDGVGLSMASLKSRIETFRADIDAIQKQNTSLKFMLYAGFVVIMAGFFYYSGIFKKSQANKVEASFYEMRNRVNHELLLIQKGLFSEILRLQEQLEKVPAGGPSPAELSDILDRMNSSIESLQPQGMETQELVDEVHHNSMEFLKVYGQHAAFK